MPFVAPVDDFRLSPRAAKFQGRENGGIEVSMFVTRYANGEGPDLHFHPYPELFLVQAGQATFSVDGEDTVVAAGNIVVVEAEAVHGFKNRGEERLEVVSVHPNGEVLQTDL